VGPSSTPSQVLAILSALIEEKTGLYYGPSEFDLLREKIGPIAEERGCDSLLDYYYLLRYDDEAGREMDALVDGIVVPETYFFREFEALKLAVSEFVLPLVHAGERPRVWCAACATGEEPLTLAMLLAEQNALDRVDIVASDMSARVLARARAGEFGTRTLRHVPDPALAERWLDRSEKNVRVRAEIARAVGFRRVNLTVEQNVTALGSFDVVLCRNVLIYFKDDTAARVVSTIRKVLRPGGVLFVGATESLLRLGTSFVCEERCGTFFYRSST
jgi:chemotaxis protein methyltransferase CheR